MNYITIDIELQKSYLKNYLEYHLEDLEFITTENLIGAAIINMLRKAPEFRKPVKPDPERSVQVKVKWPDKLGVHIPAIHAKCFNAFVYEQMKHELILECSCAQRYGQGRVEIKQIINDYMAKYDIDPDQLAANSIRKWWQRSNEFIQASDSQ